MSERIVPGPIHGNANFKEAVLINADKIYDSCKDKDCIENMRVFLCHSGQALVDRAINVKCCSAEVIWAYIDLEPVPFNKGFFSVDIQFFFKVDLEVFIGVGKPQTVEGLCSFEKTVILFGSEGAAKVFTSNFRPCSPDIQSLPSTNLPKASVECVDPIPLGAKIVDACDNHGCLCTDINNIPEYVGGLFEEGLWSGDADKFVVVTLGLFSIVRIERDVQLLVPAFDFCVPEKECVETSEDPCSVFRRIKFPHSEFCPAAIDRKSTRLNSSH